jgi:hypothetical protein
MLAATVFDHPWILVIFAAITLVRWLIQKGKGEAQNTQTPPPPPPSQPITRGGETQSEEERIRKFLDALGQPSGTTPPPKVTPRQRRVEPKIFPRLPKLKTAPPPLPPAPEPWASTPPPLPIETVKAPEFNFEVRDYTRQTSSEPAPDTRRSSAVRRLKLGTPQDLRTAIVLREIFGPPRSLQPVDLTNGS